VFHNNLVYAFSDSEEEWAFASGGAISDVGALTNCVFYENTAQAVRPVEDIGSVAYGGAVNNSALTINCTFYSNHVIAEMDAQASALYCYSHPVINCVVWYDTWIGDLTYCDTSSGPWGEGCFGADPQFVSPSPFNYHLLATSPCIDGGIGQGLPFDVDGDPRSPYGAVDIGADEVVARRLLLR
jgi:hypothetical protein